eukprot:sb/3464948/
MCCDAISYPLWGNIALRYQVPGVNNRDLNLRFRHDCFSRCFIIMSFFNSTFHSQDPTSVVGDIIYAIIILCTVIVGALGNMFALTYFNVSGSTNSNGRYFKNVYMMIAIVDILICVLSLPLVEAALRDGRNAALFGDETFCTVWGCLWAISVSTSIFLIGLLSFSRLCLLMFPQVKLNPLAAVAMCVTVVVIMCIVCSCLLLSNTTFMAYKPMWMYCFFSIYPGSNLDYIITQDGYKAGIFIVILFTLIPTITFVLISISFVLSLFYLHRSQAAANLTCSGRTQRTVHAAKTVVLVTMIYIISQLPFVLLAIQTLHKRISFYTDDPMTAKDYIHLINIGSNEYFLKDLYYKVQMSGVMVMEGAELFKLRVIQRDSWMRLYIRLKTDYLQLWFMQLWLIESMSQRCIQLWLIDSMSHRCLHLWLIEM